MNITCQKNFQIVVRDDCPNWRRLNWLAGAVTTGANCVNSFTPVNAMSDSWAATTDNHNGGPTGNDVQNSTDTLFFYNGPGCQGNLQIVVAASGNLTGTNCGYRVRLEVTSPIALILAEKFTWPIGAAVVPGTYNLPFSIPNTFGVQYYIRLSLYINNSNNVAPHTDTILNVSGQVMVV